MKTILVPVDFSDVTPAVVETAKQIGCAFGSRIILLHVVEIKVAAFEISPGLGIPGSATNVVPAELDLKGGREKLEKVKASFADTPLEVTSLLIEGGTLSTIQEEGKKANLIVMGSHGHGALYHLLAGGTASGVLRSAKIPVLIVPSPGK